MKLQVQIVTRNSEQTIIKTIQSVYEQLDFEVGKNLIIRVLDNNSKDSTTDIIKKNFKEVILTPLKHNTGFCLGNNILFEHGLADGVDYFLLLNPDACIDKNAIKVLVDALRAHPESGWASPHLIRADEELNPTNITDSKGIYFTKEFRHFDRDSGKIIQNIADNDSCYVTGATGACTLMSKAFIEDVSSVFKDEFQVFNNTFFAYREDGELSLRANYLGWKCLFVPKAKAFHQRQVLHTNRAKTSDLINSHSIKNRFLMKYLSGFRWTPLPSVIRDFLVITHCTLVGRQHLPALIAAFSLKKRSLAIYKNLLSKARVSKKEVLSFFCPSPALNSQQTDLKKLSIIVVNYNSGELLLNCLESCKNEDQVIVVDNNSNDNSLELAKQKYNANDNFKFIENDKNVGFAGGFNLGLRHSDNELILLLNPDIELDQDCTENLVKQINKASNIAALSPFLFSANHGLQRDFIFKKLASPLTLLLDAYAVFRLFPNLAIVKNYFYKDSKVVQNFIEENKTKGTPYYDDLIPIEQPPAACLLVRKSIIQSIGKMSEDYMPAWFEDVDLCYRIKQNGYVSAVTNRAKAKHHGGYSVSKIGNYNFTKTYYLNMLKYVKNNFPTPYFIIFTLTASPAILARLILSKLK